MVDPRRLAALPLLSGFDATLLRSLTTGAEERVVRVGDVVLRQHEDARHVFLLLAGAVAHRLAVQGGGDLMVGRTDRVGSLIGWSAFCPPYRYTTTTTADETSVLLRLPRGDVNRFIEQDPTSGRELLSRVAQQVADRIEQARNRLVRLGGEGDLLRSRHERLGTPQRRDLESVVGRLSVLQRSRLLATLHNSELERLARSSRVQHLAPGDRPVTEGAPGHGVAVLSSGRLMLSVRAGERDVPIRAFQETGDTVGWSALVPPHRYRTTVVADSPSELLVVSRAEMDRLTTDTPRSGIDFGRGVIRFLSDRLTELRMSLIAQRYHEETVAIRTLLDQHAEEIRVRSPLLKIPHLLSNRLTFSDAVDTLERLVEAEDLTEQTVAEMCLELLDNARRELRVYEGLQRIYDCVSCAPMETPPAALRQRCSEEFSRLFSSIHHVIRGLEHLPPTPGHLFIMNHLRSHPDNVLPNDFCLLLDTHFVSSMVLHPRYGAPPIRVVRREYPSEFMQKNYYDRLGFIAVEARGTTGYAESDRSTRWEAFRGAVREHLLAHHNVLICPEGTPTTTEKSPGPFHSGVLRLAASLHPEPLIVPIVVANFDKRITRTTPAAVVHQPFYVSHLLDDPSNRDQITTCLDRLRARFHEWVQDASAH